MFDIIVELFLILRIFWFEFFCERLYMYEIELEFFCFFSFVKDCNAVFFFLVRSCSFDMFLEFERLCCLVRFGISLLLMCKFFNCCRDVCKDCIWGFIRFFGLWFRICSGGGGVGGGRGGIGMFFFFMNVWIFFCCFKFNDFRFFLCF